MEVYSLGLCIQKQILSVGRIMNFSIFILLFVFHKSFLPVCLLFSFLCSVAGTFTPKSPTHAPPPAYPGSGAAPQSPKFAPPPKETLPQYPSDVPQYPSNTQDEGETTDEVDKQFSKSILDEV